EYGMQMDDMQGTNMEEPNPHDKMGMKDMDLSKDSMKMDHSKMAGKEMKKDGGMKGMEMDHSNMNKSMGNKDEMSDMQGMDMFSEYNYDYLKSPEKTTYDASVP
ncbi:MAG: multicopper oxidase domain-containing protein, partial [Flavobacteriales bacterium]